MTACLADETIAAWAAGALTDAERERAIEHAASCSICRAVVGQQMTNAAPSGGTIGRYEIRGPLGAGGMGVVLRGHDASLGRDVAIKMIKSTLLDPAHRQRLLGEAQAMAKVRHPNVVTVHELGEAGEELYVAMELVEGTMLQRWLQERRPLAQRVALVLAIGRGVAAVHAAGLLHRDIKPDNIVVRDDGTPVLVDFGLARPTAAQAFGAGSGIAGTPRYLAPEVAAGAAASAASDQFQWWTIVEEALPGVRAVASLVARGHDPDPARRFASMFDAVAALERATRPPRRLYLLAIPLAALVAAGTVAVVYSRDRAATPCERRLPKGWSYEQRTAIAAAVQRAGLDPKPVLASLDARVRQTVDLRERGCRATTPAERGEWTRRLVCIDETWAKTAPLIVRLASSEGDSVREAADELGDVGRVERCARGALPAAPAPRDEATRERERVLDERMKAIEADSSLRPRERADKLRAMGAEIAAVQYPRLEAVWHWKIAYALNAATDVAGAAAEFELAAQAALAGGDDDLYVRALIVELQLASQAASADKIAQIEAQAQAGARRLASTPVDAELARGRAALHHDRGDSAKARALYEEADRLYSAISVAPMAMHMAVLQNLGGLLLEQGDLDGAERAIGRAIAIARGRYTEERAEYWQARAAAATLPLARGDLDRAERELLAVVGGLARTGSESSEIGRLRAYVCLVRMAKRDYAGARAECARSLDALAAAVGPESPHAIWTLTIAGQVELRDGRYEDGLRFLDRALALAAAGNVRSIELATARGYRAIALLGAKRVKEARAAAAEAAPLLRAPEMAETRRDFLRAFPELAAAASP